MGNGRTEWLGAALVVGMLACDVSRGAATDAGPTTQTPLTPEWNERAARHLFNRAGFGATRGEISEAVDRSHADLVAELLDGRAETPPFDVQSLADLRRTCREGPPEDLEHRLRIANQEQLRAYTLWWIDAMLSGADPLRDRLTLFWHGFFTTSVRIVRQSGMIATQHQLLRDNALGNYANLLSGIVHDPAMLEYLDAAQNVKGAGNENFARELMELFSLGEGEFTERDVREVSRALTGLGFDEEGRGVFDASRHDDGEKCILGEVGKHGPDDVVRILLAQPACARWVAGSLIEYMEGIPPARKRLDRYADLLRDANYELRPLLRELLLDPEFYRSEVVGTRVQSPIDYYIGSMHRLRLPVPALSIHNASAELGHELFAPPSVKGWNEGFAWATTSAVITRANYAGVMLGVVDLRSIHAALGVAETAIDAPNRLQAVPMCRKAPTGSKIVIAQRLIEWADHLDACERPPEELLSRFPPAAFHTDESLADEILARSLAIDAPADLRAALIARVSAERAASGATGSPWRDPPATERFLRRSCHYVLSSPAAQLH